MQQSGEGEDVESDELEEDSKSGEEEEPEAPKSPDLLGKTSLEPEAYQDSVQLSTFFVCEMPNCGAAFSSMQALNGHARIHGGTNQVTKPSPRGKPKAMSQSGYGSVKSSPAHSTTSGEADPTLIFPCKECGKVFFKIKSRNAHMKTHRQQEEQERKKQQQQQGAQEAFSSMQALNGHARIHGGTNQVTKPSPRGKPKAMSQSGYGSVKSSPAHSTTSGETDPTLIFPCAKNTRFRLFQEFCHFKIILVNIFAFYGRLFCFTAWFAHGQTGMVCPWADHQKITETEEPDSLYKNVAVLVKGHDKAVLDSYQYFATLAAQELGINIDKVYEPPKRIERLTLLKSVHIFKKHRVQYEMRTYYRCIEQEMYVLLQNKPVVLGA
ncbi:Transcriptional-regulating factor 1 [Acipenser ruthenus]|uniref:Small ribosomal subunit protein uS10m n=1 Tax=Acipenser ruthenus TaxID=7906 RepID=A0A444U561_ACIRT|nr:Transcriptional-regulating factor 1 [Acipenser ruthenus]